MLAGGSLLARTQRASSDVGAHPAPGLAQAGRDVGVSEFDDESRGARPTIEFPQIGMPGSKLCCGLNRLMSL